MKRFDGVTGAALAENRHFDLNGFHFLCNGLFRLCIVPRMPVADNGLVRPLIGFALDLVTAVAFDGLNEAISDTHYNARMVCGAVIVAVLEKYLVSDFGGLVKPSSGLVVFQREAAACAEVASLALKVFGFILVPTAKLIKAPICKCVTPVKALFVAVVISCFV